jgi:hypothetical protein
MRCPKCGYISFDQEETCGKCSASLAEISGRLTGTGVRVQEFFFLGSVTGQAVQQGPAAEGVEFDLAVADERPEADVEIEAGEYEEGIPMVDLSAFAQGEEQTEAAAEEGISFTPLAEEQGAQAAGLEVETAAEQGTIDFTFEEEPLPQAALELEEEAAEVDLTLGELSLEAEQVQPGGIEFELPAEEPAEEEQIEALPELDLQIAGGEAEEEVEVDAGLLPDLEAQMPAEAEEPGAAAPTAAGAGLNLDIDVDLEDEPSEEELVFNLEDIDMSDLVIDESGAAKEKAARPEDTALDLEDFLNEGKGDDEGPPMDLTMEDLELGDESDKDAPDKKSGKLPDLEP